MGPASTLQSPFGTSEAKVSQRVPRTALSEAQILRFSRLAVTEHDDPVILAGDEEETLVICA